MRMSHPAVARAWPSSARMPLSMPYWAIRGTLTLALVQSRPTSTPARSPFHDSRAMRRRRRQPDGGAAGGSDTCCNLPLNPATAPAVCCSGRPVLLLAVTSPPVAKRVPTERDRHGDTVVDEYAWLRDRDDP